MNYCSACGHKVVFGIPEGDNRERFHCEHCRTIHYQNPRVVTGCLPIWEDKILLCRRAIEPRSGYWTLSRISRGARWAVAQGWVVTAVESRRSGT